MVGWWVVVVVVVVVVGELASHGPAPDDEVGWATHSTAAAGRSLHRGGNGVGKDHAVPLARRNLRRAPAAPEGGKRMAEVPFGL